MREPYKALEGKWGTFARVAELWIRKVKPEDKDDFRHDLILEMAKVKAKYNGRPFTEAAMMQVARYELLAYWEREKLRARGLIVDCGSCSRDQRRECREYDLYSRCRRAKRIIALHKVENTETQSEELDDWLDAKDQLLALPKEMIQAGLRKLNFESPLKGREMPKKIDRFRETIRQMADNGVKGSQILREIRGLGYDGCHAPFYEYLAKLKIEIERSSDYQMIAPLDKPLI